MKARVKSEDGIQLSTICRQLRFESTDGKKYERDCVNTEGLFRIIQSIASPKAEPFKLWLAKVGYERVQEIENPELAQEHVYADSRPDLLGQHAGVGNVVVQVVRDFIPIQHGDPFGHAFGGGSSCWSSLLFSFFLAGALHAQVVGFEQRASLS